MRPTTFQNHTMSKTKPGLPRIIGQPLRVSRLNRVEQVYRKVAARRDVRVWNFGRTSPIPGNDFIVAHPMEAQFTECDSALVVAAHGIRNIVR